MSSHIHYSLSAICRTSFPVNVFEGIVSEHVQNAKDEAHLDFDQHDASLDIASNYLVGG